MKKLILLISFIMIGVTLLGTDEKTEMKKLILKIRDKSPENFIMISQNGTDIFFQEKGKVDKELLGAVDGITQESLFYGYPKYGERTPYEERRSLLKKLRILKSLNKMVMTVNYTNSSYGKWRSRSLAEEEEFLNYCPKEREAAGISEKLFFENKDDILDISQAKNFLYLLNPVNFRYRKEYINALSQTKYDVIIIDMYFHGIKLTAEDIEKLRKKPQGGQRLVIGYFSIGEAEDYREYWKGGWDRKLPNWISHENENWEGNYIVKYWSKEWKKIVDEMLIKFIDTGFDGVFLDTIDTYESFEKEE
ncbi:endo alpha-1,4 polygalactosaminidase [Fusobacteria bacterium ZRK30]|nr:endo alpha-1,4 polygalactosaminidase [Fusobacteria bacterium ZRK30]